MVGLHGPAHHTVSTTSRELRAYEQVVSAQLRWYERSIVRFYADSSNAPKRETDEIELEAKVGYIPEKEDRPSSVIIRQRVKAELRDADATFEAAVNFRMRQAPAGAEAIQEFSVEVGFEYVFGLIRAAVADGTRSVGLSAALLPSVDFTEFRSIKVDQLDLF